MRIRRQRRKRRLGLLVGAMVVALASASTPAPADDSRENPPSRPRPVDVRLPSGGDQPRTAVPRDPGSTPSPSTRHEPRPSGGGSAGPGHGRPHYPSHYGHGFYGYGYHWPYSRFFRPYWSHFYYPYYPWGMVWYPAYTTDARLGGLDLSVKPKKADVYVDGEYIGRAGKYDGWPGHLWLEAGAHELVFHYQGRETEVRNVNVRPGPVRRLRLDMEKGESRPPEDVFARSERPVLREDAGVTPRSEAAAERAPRQASIDLRGEPGRFSLEVSPVDAAVYLDGRFLGSAEELARLHAGMMVDAGDHLLEVQRPGYETERIQFSVAAGDQRDLQVDLESSAGSGG